MADARQEVRWVLRAQAGDREALDALFKMLQEPLYRYLLSLAGDVHTAEDLLQEVFILIYRKLTWLREPEYFRSWVWRIASREAFKRLKKERRWTEQVREEAVLEALPAATEEPGVEWTEALRQGIASLSPASRAVVVLHYQEELSLEEISSILDIPFGTVKSRLAYGLKNLRLRLEQTSQKGTEDV